MPELWINRDEVNVPEETDKVMTVNTYIISQNILRSGWPGQSKTGKVATHTPAQNYITAWFVTF